MERSPVFEMRGLRPLHLTDAELIANARAGRVVVYVRDGLLSSDNAPRAAHVMEPQPKPEPTVPYMWLGADALGAITGHRTVARIAAERAARPIWPDPRDAWHMFDWR